MLKYRGGKSKEIPLIMRHIPKFEGKYIEPFLGGGALFFHIEPERSVINDINPRLMSFYRGIAYDYDRVRRELDLMELKYANNKKWLDKEKASHPDIWIPDPNETLYYIVRDMYNYLIPSTLHDATLYYILNKMAYSGMIRYNTKGEFNVPYGRYNGIGSDCVTEGHSILLRKAIIKQGDYHAIFDLSDPDDLMFLDPPYDCVFSDYGNERYKDGFGEDEHKELAACVRNSSCKIVMVIGKTPLTHDLYNGMIADEWKKNYAVNIRNRSKAEAIHMLVKNF